MFLMEFLHLTGQYVVFSLKFIVGMIIALNIMLSDLKMKLSNTNKKYFAKGAEQ